MTQEDLRNGAPDHGRRPRCGTRQGCCSGYVLYSEKHTLACLYLWESLELDNAELTFRATLPPKEVGEG